MKVFSFIPYYGGLPPGVDLNTLKINSLGQGNSLVSNLKILNYYIIGNFFCKNFLLFVFLNFF